MNCYFNLRQPAHYIVDNASGRPKFKPIYAPDEGAQEGGNLHFGKVHSHAGVYAMTESHVIGVSACNIKAVGKLPLALVPVRGTP